LLLLPASLVPAETYYCWAGLSLLMMPLVMPAEHSVPVNALSVSLAFFCALLLANVLFHSPHYEAYSLYRPFILLPAFAAVAFQPREDLERLFAGGIAVMSVLVLFGLLQVLLGVWPYKQDVARAAASFATPNTFATAINLFLLPLIALFCVGRGGRWIYPALLWLFAGLLSTESRGGWLALIAGLAFVVWYLGFPRTTEAATRWKKLVAGTLWVLITYYVLKAFLPQLSASLDLSPGALFVENMAWRGTSYRLDLTLVALRQIAEHPIAGTGANTFLPLYEMLKPEKLDVGFSIPFAHNDYLQTWLEYGLGGIAFLCAIMYASGAILMRARMNMREGVLPLVAGAALAGFFTHAFVDFPLYVPFPVMVLGAWLGVLVANAGDAGSAKQAAVRVRAWIAPLRTPLVATALLAAAIAWLAQPTIAYVASRHAVAALFAGRADEGLYWQSVARRLEPRSGMRHWEEGVIWREQALAARDKALAAKADERFAEGFRMDPYDVNNLAERVRLHRMHADLLEQPASPATVLEWSRQLLALQPYSVMTRAEYARALAYAGRGDEARQLARALADRHPNSALARRVASEI
jgi:O-antigen ligase